MPGPWHEHQVYQKGNAAPEPILARWVGFTMLLVAISSTENPTAPPNLVGIKTCKNPAPNLVGVAVNILATLGAVRRLGEYV